MSYQRYSCAKADGFIYMFRDGEIAKRPKRLYGENIERELQSMTTLAGYMRVSPEEFDRLSFGAPFTKEVYWHEQGGYWSEEECRDGMSCSACLGRKWEHDGCLCR